jgi:hypothetical protein
VTIKIKNLYKFQSVNTNSVTALENNQIWLSDLESLNDPFEGVVHLKEPISSEDKISSYHKLAKNSLINRLSISDSEAHQLALKRYIDDPKGFIEFCDERIKKFKEDLLFNKSNLGIYSTASDIPNDSRTQIANMLLWSHYGDGFSGFCLKFNIQKLYESLVKLNPSYNFGWTAVNYVLEPYEVDIYSNAGKSALDFFKGLQCKHEQWIYECEIRFLSTGKGLMNFSSDSLEGIYLGGKISSKNEEKLKCLLASNFPKTDLFKASLSKSKYEIVVEKI